MTQATVGHVLRIGLTHLHPSPNNPRRISAKDPRLAELAESLKTLGQIEPIVVREIVPAPGADEHPFAEYEILAGERRYRAAKLAGLDDLEAKIVTCDDRHALEITVVENLQRQDLHPIEEAAGVASLLKADWPIADIAKHLGKTPRWVQLRAQLVNLSPLWREAIAVEDHVASRLTAGHLELVARLEPSTQDELMSEDHAEIWTNYEGKLESVASCSESIARLVLFELDKALWKLDDAELVPAAGACASCPKRTSAQQELFSDLPGKKRDDRCLDGACWKGKAAAYRERTLAEVKAKHGEQAVVIVDHQVHKPAAGEVLPYEVEKAKQSDPEARPAVDTKGKVSWVKPVAHASPATLKRLGVTRKGQVEKGDGKGGKRGRPTKEETAAHELAQARENHIREAIETALKRRERPDLPMLVRLAIIFGLDLSYTDVGGAVGENAWKQVAKRTEEQDAKLIWAEILQQEMLIENSLGCGSDVGKVPAGFLDFLGLDAETLKREASIAHPDPTVALGSEEQRAASADTPPPAKRGTKAKPAKAKKAAKPKKAKPAKVAKAKKARGAA